MQRLILVSLFVFASLSAQPTPIPGDSESWLQKGVDAYRSGQFQNAIDAFQLAADFDPNDVTAHLYLATANMVLYVPGDPSKANLARSEGAKIEFKHALELDPGNLTALLSLGTLCLRESGAADQPDIAKLDEARAWYLKVLNEDPRNKNALYTIGVIDWRKVNPALASARVTLGMKPEDSGPLDPKVRSALKAQYGPVNDEGISSIHKALEVDPGFEEAMSYLNLLLRQRAELADSPAESQKDIAEADQSIQKMVDLRASKGQPGGMTPNRMRVTGNVQAARLLTKVDPKYPQLALQAKVQGTIRFTATIGKDGKVVNLQLISGHPLLVAAAREAAEKWTYQPTTINGQPVDVVTTIDVNFTLPQ